MTPIVIVLAVNSDRPCKTPKVPEIVSIPNDVMSATAIAHTQTQPKTRCG